MLPAPPALDAQSSADLLTRARQLVNQRRWTDAELAYRELLEGSPDHVEALEGLGLAALHARRPADGLAWLRRARDQAPRDPRVLANFGLALKQNGLLVEAIETLRQSAALGPTGATFVNLARAEREAGRLSAAIESFRRAIELDRNAPDVWSMLSNALREAGQIDEALTAVREALVRNPWHGQAHLNEGTALHRAGRLPDAIVSYWLATASPASQKGANANLDVAFADPQLLQPPEAQLVRHLRQNPGDEKTLLALARRERQKGRLATALCCFERAAELRPASSTYQDIADLAWAIGHTDRAQERLRRAFECPDSDAQTYRRFGSWLLTHPRFQLLRPGWKEIVERCPDDWPALVNLGVALQRRGLPSLAESLQRRALRIDDRRIEPYVNLGASLNDHGRTKEAIAVYRQGLAQHPRASTAVSNLLYALHFDPELSPQRIYEEHVAFGRTFAAPLQQARRYPHARDPERRLRIGYVSPDFRWHPVSYFLEPILAEHDPESVEIHCYSDVEVDDEVTARMARLVHRFTKVTRWPDERLSEQIASDQIDILIDLAGHTGNSRLLVFARKPSPIQISWLGYFDTTGLTSIDYRLADRHSIPPEAERYFTERVWHLPRSSNCFRPTAAPDPAPPPSLRAGHITFGCYNNPAKITRQVVATFARILREVQDSRLILKYGAFEDPGVRAQYGGWLDEEGIPRERFEFRGHSSLHDFMASYADIDIALDPFPYSGETTALHTLWMGVPLVTLEGATLVQRLGSRVLRVAGMDEWVAGSIDEYVRIAVALAEAPSASISPRAGLRERLRRSALFDHRGVTRELEEALRQIWRRWCADG